MERFKDKVAVITGAGVGIGAGTARRMAAKGAAVVLMGRRAEKLDKVAEDIRKAGGRVTTMVGDVSDAEDCDRLMKLAADTYGRLDILVNNAGLPDFHMTAKMVTNEMWEKNIAANQTGVLFCCRSALPYMEAQGKGTIVVVSSIGGIYANCGVSTSASKAAGIAVVKNIAMQYAGRGIRANAVCPGPTLHDPIYDSVSEHDPHHQPMDPDFFETTSRHTDMRVKPSELYEQVNIILFLAGDESSAINGQAIVSDHGMCM